jgi:hypothetical protein
VTLLKFIIVTVNGKRFTQKGNLPGGDKQMFAKKIYRTQNKNGRPTGQPFLIK